jgi:hypothetical protein
VNVWPQRTHSASGRIRNPQQETSNNMKQESDGTQAASGYRSRFVPFFSFPVAVSRFLLLPIPQFLLPKRRPLDENL